MERKKILLYYPLLNKSKQERDYHWFPYSVLPLAQSLSESGYEPVIIDRRVNHNSSENLRDYLEDIVFVGISAMSGYQIQDGLEIAKNIRNINPDIPIVWGGWHPTILPEETADHPLVDIAVAGRGEGTIVEIADAIRHGKGIDHITGLAYISGETVTFTGYKKPSKLRDDAQQYSKFIPIESYINPKTMALGYFSGHGCAFRCAFCSRHFMTNRYSPNPVGKVIDDIQYFVNKYGFRHIHFQDDNFFLDIKRVLQIAQELVSSGIDVTWWANVRADVMHRLSKEEIALLIKSGLNCLFIGAESASQELLDTINKGINPEDIIKTNEVLKDYDVALSISYMFGLPEDDIEKLRLTINQVKLLQRTNRRLLRPSWDLSTERIQVQTCFYQPYPGTELYQTALDWGYPKLKGLEEWGRVKPQSEVARIPWLTDAEMALYEKEFNSFFEQGV